jgi:hypothetical protein
VEASGVLRVAQDAGCDSRVRLRTYGPDSLQLNVKRLDERYGPT